MVPAGCYHRPARFLIGVIERKLDITADSVSHSLKSLTVDPGVAVARWLEASCDSTSTS